MKLLTAALVGVFTSTNMAVADETATGAIYAWQVANDVVISTEARAQLAGEIETVVNRVQASDSLRDQLTDAVLDDVVVMYLDNNLNRTQSPALLSLTVEALSPGGIGPAYPTAYPVLILSTTFDMTGVSINNTSVAFEPTKTKTLLLSFGSNDIVTRGGGTNDCQYTIDAEKGHSYTRDCPEAP